MPFGMINSASTLKCAVKMLLGDLVDIDFYWDDIGSHPCVVRTYYSPKRGVFAPCTSGVKQVINWQVQSATTLQSTHFVYICTAYLFADRPSAAEVHEQHQIIYTKA